MSMASVSQAITGAKGQGEGEEGRADGNAVRSGEALLEVIRLLTEMAPDERTTLIGFLKALG